MGEEQDMGASFGPGSRASTEPASGLGPVCFDPSREPCEGCGQPSCGVDSEGVELCFQCLSSVVDAGNSASAIVASWQPIATAPKDGTRFLAIVDGDVRFVSWAKASHTPLQGWCLVDQGMEDCDLCAPRWWMPLPEPSVPLALVPNPHPGNTGKAVAS